MELSQTVKNNFTFLEGLTTDDLDNILDIDNANFETTEENKLTKDAGQTDAITSNVEETEIETAEEIQIEAETVSETNATSLSILEFNREPLCSFDTNVGYGEANVHQDFRFSQSNLCDSTLDLNLSCLSPKQVGNNGNTTESVIITSQDIEMIVLDDTEAPKTFEEALNEVIANEKNLTQTQQDLESCKDMSNLSLSFSKASDQNAPLNMSSTQANTRQPIDSSFEEEFAKFQGVDFETDILDLDFDEIDALEKTFVGAHKVADPGSRKIKTQLVTPLKKNDQTLAAAKNQVSISCPVQNREDDKESIMDPMHYLALNYSMTTDNSPAERPQRFQPPSPIQGLSPCPDLPTLLENDPLPQSLRPTYVMENCLNTSPELNKTQTTDLQLLLANNSAADASLVPASVKNLYDVIKEKFSDFAFVYALSAQVCQDRIPMDCFVNLKMVLLLSLASIGTNPDRPPIPIIAIGSDTYVINILMQEIGQLSERFVGPTDNTKPPSSTGYRNHNWIEADPMLLAKGGVFYIRDWSRLKLARADKLFKCIECSRIGIEKTTYEYPLETAIWAYWRSFKYNSRDQQSFNKFVKIFGIPVYVDEGNHETLVDYILQQYSIRLFESTVDHLSISNDEMRQFIAAISKRNVDLSQEASLLLQKYFVASRIERPDCLTKQAFVVLKQFSESFAKLSMRHEVLEIDVIAAIFLSESFLQNIFGSSEMPPPPFQSHNFIGSVDEQLAEFQTWLNKYINKFYDKQ